LVKLAFAQLPGDQKLIVGLALYCDQ
jgi:hypothetical protein